MDFTTILLIAVGVAAGALLGWLLRGERRERSDAIRLARLHAQIESQQGLLERQQRQRNDLQKVADELRHRQHQAERRTGTMREALDEQLAANRKLNKRLRRTQALAEQHASERKRLSRQLRLLIKRTQQARSERSAPAAESSPDINLGDLQSIRGIGPALARKLEAAGISSIRELAELDDGAIEELDNVLKFPGRIRRDRWVEQARELIEQAAAAGHEHTG